MFKILVPLLLSLFVATEAFAAHDAEQFMKAKQTELQAAAKAEGAEREQRFAKVFDSMLDYRHLAQASLQDYWEGRTEAQHKEFQDLLTQLVQRAYRKNLDKTANYEVVFKGEVDTGNGMLVQTVASDKRNPRSEPVSIDYLLLQVEHEWMVQDIVTEGSSLVKNYRQQFARIIKKKKPDEEAGFADLVLRMKKKLEE